MHYMVIERFRAGAADAVYRRLRDQGRLLPEGLQYVSSWVELADPPRCFQVMRCPRRELLTEWIAQWADLVDFEVAPVVTSAEAAARWGDPHDE